MARERGPKEVVGRVARRVGRAAVEVARTPLRLPGAAGHRRRHVGAPAGIDRLPEAHQPPAAQPLRLRCIDYAEGRVEERDFLDLEALLADPRPDWVRVRWIDVAGLDPYVVRRFREVFELHTLAAEDVLHVPQRPKAEVYDEHLFVVVRMLRAGEGALLSEQVSLFLREGLLVTFQETPEDLWDPIRERLRTEGSRIRRKGADYLFYGVVDAIVDHGFPLLESYGDRLERLEEKLWARPEPAVLQEIHAVKHELGVLRRILWPTREMVSRLARDEEAPLEATTRTFLRDVDDHAVQLVDLVETLRESAGGLVDLYMSLVSYRMNEIMKVLTIMASFFIPITFFAGVYGMNFEHMPELAWPWAYGVFWAICLAVLAGLFVFFRRRGWIGR